MPLAIAGAIFGGGLLSSGAQIWGAQSAANAQTQAAQQAIQAQLGMFQQARGGLDPFIQGGQGAFNMLTGDLASLTTPFGAPAGSGPTGKVDSAGLMAALQATPGYQFALDQGLKATTNSLVGSQGTGGNLGKGLANYAEGLASTTYQQQYDNYLKQQQQAYGMLMGTSQVGAGAANALAGTATAIGGQIGQDITGIGNARAGGAIGTANAISGLGGLPMQYLMMQNLLSGGGGFGSKMSQGQPSYTDYGTGQGAWPMY